MLIGCGLVLGIRCCDQFGRFRCYHLYTPYAEPFPGTVLSTGMEDYFDSAYGFGGGQFKMPVAGCTHRTQLPSQPHSMQLSAYRFHEEDPVAFTVRPPATRAPAVPPVVPESSRVQLERERRAHSFA